MTGATALEQRSPLPAADLRAPRLSPVVLVALVAAALGLAVVLVALTPLAGAVGLVLAAVPLIGVLVGAATAMVEGRRAAVNRLVAGSVLVAFLVAMLPLVGVLSYTIAEGLSRLDLSFLTHSMAGIGPLDQGGGIYHAILGTLEQVAIAAVLAVPLGLLVALYLTEYGRGRLATSIRFLVDVMTGIPSIVAGLFIFAFWVLVLDQGFSGLAAGLALAILMLPVVVRSAEEMLRLVPTALRESAYALGIPHWKTVLRVVLPTAASGITTGVMLALARVTGETAPLLLTAGGNVFIQANPVQGQQSALPLFIFENAGSAYSINVERAWAAALTLLILVVVLYVSARLLTRRSAVGGR